MLVHDQPVVPRVAGLGIEAAGVNRKIVRQEELGVTHSGGEEVGWMLHLKERVRRRRRKRRWERGVWVRQLLKERLLLLLKLLLERWHELVVRERERERGRERRTYQVLLPLHL